MVSFLRSPPEAYGQRTVEEAFRDFERRHECVVPRAPAPPPNPTTPARHHHPRHGCVPGTARLPDDPPLAEIAFPGVDGAATRHLWPVSMLLTRAGATEVPARVAGDEARAETEAALDALARDLGEQRAFRGGCADLFRLALERVGDRGEGTKSGRDAAAGEDDEGPRRVPTRGPPRRLPSSTPIRSVRRPPPAAARARAHRRRAAGTAGTRRRLAPAAAGNAAGALVGTEAAAAEGRVRAVRGAARAAEAAEPAGGERTGAPEPSEPAAETFREGESEGGDDGGTLGGGVSRGGTPLATDGTLGADPAARSAVPAGSRRRPHDPAAAAAAARGDRPGVRAGKNNARE